MHATGKPLTKQVDLNLLELFDTIYRMRNLTRAGERLGMSQPAVSYGLARLRGMYGDALFVRVQRGVQPTPFSDDLAGPVAQALQIVRNTVTKASFEPTQARHTFRIAMADIGERMFLPSLWAWLAEEAPGIRIETVAPPLDRLAEGLANGEVDLAVGYIPGLDKQVHQRTLFTERFVYLQDGQRAGSGPKLTLARIRTMPHVIASPEGTEHATAVERVLQGPNINATIALRVGSFLSLGPLVAGTDLVAPVPSNLAAVVAPNLGLKIRKPTIRLPSFDVSLYWHQRFNQDPAVLWLRQSMGKLFDGARAFQ